MNGIPLLILFIYSGFTINLVLQCGLGIRGIVESKNLFDISALTRIIIIFFTVILLWFLFTSVLYRAIPGIFIYIILFPVSAVIYSGFEYLIFRFVLKKENENDNESMVSFSGGITAVAVFICINLAEHFTEVVILSFGFTAGILLINVIIWEIRRRASLETVPVFMRGRPLILITMGLLSLVFTTASILLFRMISAG